MELTTRQKVYAGSALAGLIAIIVSLQQCVTESPEPGPSSSSTSLPTPSPSSSPSSIPTSGPSTVPSATPLPSPAPTPFPVPSPTLSPLPQPTALPSSGVTLKILDSIEKIDYAQETQWKKQASRSLPQGASSGFALRVETGSSCAIVGTPSLSAFIPVSVATPSYVGGKTGTFYDAMFALNPGNCAAAKYLWWEIPAGATRTLTLADVSVTLNVKSWALPAVEGFPLYVGLHQSYLQWGYYGKAWGGREGDIAKIWGTAMRAHRLIPTNGTVTNPPVAPDMIPGPTPTSTPVPNPIAGQLDLNSGSQYGTSWNQVVGAYTPAPHLQYMPNGVNLTALGKTTGIRPYFYVADEPSSADYPTLNSKAQAIKAAAPFAKTMVTVSYSPQLSAFDIFVPVMNYFTDPAPYAGKEVWLYSSCMSHSCTMCNGDVWGRACFNPGTDNGYPDLVLDRPASHLMGFYATALKYSPTVKGLLYYAIDELEQFTRVSSTGVFSQRAIDTPWAFGGNMDGQLAYTVRPGEYGSTDIGIAVSHRMKLLRHASQFADMLLALKAKDPTAYTSVIQSLARTTKDWEKTTAPYEAAWDLVLSKL